MTAKRLFPRRGGPTQPEHLRVNQRLHLRLPPPAVAQLRSLAQFWGLSLSDTVVELMSRCGLDTDEDSTSEALVLAVRTQ